MKKAGKVGVENVTLKVWCEHCSIRIAPSEKRVESDGKTYHQSCYEKHHSAEAKAKDSASRAGTPVGHKR